MQYSSTTLNTHLCVLNSSFSKAGFFLQNIYFFNTLYFSLFLKIDDNFFKSGVGEKKIKSDSTCMRFRLIMLLFEASCSKRAERYSKIWFFKNAPVCSAVFESTENN